MSSKETTLLTIGEVSDRSGIPASALRFYEFERLLPKAIRIGGKRRYNSTVFTQLSLIQLAKSAGFAISEIRTLMAGFERRTPPAKQWLAMGEQKIIEVDIQIQKLMTIRKVLNALVKCKCSDLNECASILK